ncbi:hypothetical protein COV13_01520 [Candidatus Woesearchaeota archaeon CG10_big_fil_rev_8_21_14_0_10_32_9]|nr:MAG: hypothetical protein COV13_01520 [Candidatus Woesearchaeota archaeon CG10_big_fil_rev_8_21_14_0_10_32_9]
MNCERCNREINHNGRCLPCNYLYKHKAFFPGLRISDEYDKTHNVDLELVHKLVSEKEFKPSDKKEKVISKSEKIIEDSKKFKKCLRCNCELKDRKYLYCVDCFRFIKKYANIKNYKEFLMIFDLEDSIESKDNYIEFVDDMNKFFDLEDFSVEGILNNPSEYLEKVTPNKKRD